MGIRVTKVEVITLRTSEQAREVAQRLKGLGGTESEREDKPKRIARIKGKILGNEVRPFEWAVGHVISSGLRRRVNGQHSSEAVLGLTPEEWKQVRFPLTAVWQEWDCDDQTDLANLFEQFDPSWSSRNAEDLVGAHLGIHDDLSQAIDRHVAVKVTQGIAWYHGHVERKKTSQETRFQLIHENHGTHDFLRWCGSIFSKKKTPEMLLEPVMAVVYHTSLGGNEDVRAFWKRIAVGKAALDADTSEYKLVEYLEKVNDSKSEWPRSTSRHFAKGAVRPTTLDTFATCLNAFAAWRTGRKIGDVFAPAKGKDAGEILVEFVPTAVLAVA